MPLTPGQRLGAYEVVCPLGAGGMGEVYRARDTRLGRDVALKVLPPEVVNEPGRLERFDREARAIAALNHPHIVTIYSTEDAGGIRFLTMELVDGCTLSDLVMPSGMAIPRFLEIAIPLADALAAAHQKQITHRDLKPGNVMVSNDNRVKVLDFGLARVGGGEAGEQTLIATQAPITHQGTIVGTMPYMSPEQVEGRPLDPRTDLFSLGVIFYELLNGDRPFKGSSSPALMSAILRDTPTGLADKRPDIPDALDRLITRLLEKQPEDRVQTARDVFNELRHIKTESSTGVQRRLSDGSTTGNLTVAVRPFVPRGTDEDSTTLAEGLTDDIIHGLSRFGYLRVLSRSAGSTNARYTLSGQVRKAGASFRISATLADNASGVNIWAEQYDRAGADAFAIQDEVAGSIVATIGDYTGVLGRTAAAAQAERPVDELGRAELVARPPSSTSGSQPSARTSSPSIAVMPFTDLSEKKDQDWFCDGIAEELLNTLSSLPGLRVAARASTFSLRGKGDDLRAIGEKLNVTTVLEGSVRRAGDRVRITTQLSDAKESRQLWSERFDREIKDIFDVQEEIARAIAERLRVTIAGGSDARLVQQGTTNIEAYELLLKGRAMMTRRGRAVLDAIPMFERAIALDPNLSEAHALLGDAYRLMALYGIAPAHEVVPKARACAERALAIDPNQAEALATTAILATIYEWDLAALYARSDRALAADPNHVRALAERAISVAVVAQPDPKWHAEVHEHIGRARALDPLNAWVMALEAATLLLTGRVAASVETARRAVEIDPNNFTAHWMYVCTLSEAGREDDALAAAVPALAMSGRHTMILTNVAAIYWSRGETDKVEPIRAELRERARTSYIGQGSQALVAAAAGQWDEARELLAKGIADRDPWIAFWKLYAWRPIWADEQCAALIRATSLFTGAGQ